MKACNKGIKQWSGYLGECLLSASGSLQGWRVFRTGVQSK